VLWADHLLIIYPLRLGDVPAPVYRWLFGAHSRKSLKRNVLRLVGVSPIRRSLVGMASQSPAARVAWLTRMEKPGSRAA